MVAHIHSQLWSVLRNNILAGGNPKDGIGVRLMLCQMSRNVVILSFSKNLFPKYGTFETINDYNSYPNT